MEEAHPVADFVRNGLSEVEVSCGAARRGAVENGAAVVLFLSSVSFLLQDQPQAPIPTPIQAPIFNAQEFGYGVDKVLT